MTTGFEKNGLYYEVIDEKKKTVKVRYANWNSKPTGVLSIPASVDNEGKKYTVVGIGGSGRQDYTYSHYVLDKRKKNGLRVEYEEKTHKWRGFEGCDGLVSVKMPKTITTIESFAFECCEKLSKIELPTSLETIGCGAFKSCKELATIKLPDNVKKIDGSTFSDCYMLKEINIPLNIEAIEDYTFSHCNSLKKIFIPANINVIRRYAFSASNDEIKEGKFLKEAVIDNSDENLTIESGAFPKETKISYKKKGLLSKLFGK